jgi:hypothetical protein
MQDSNIYRKYADDCRRIAETMNAKDKAIMLEMAKVWDERAEDAERSERSKPSVVELDQKSRIWQCKAFGQRD